MVEDVGKLLIIFGLMLFLFGILLILLSKFGGSIPIGKLPGDIYIKKDNFIFFFPITSSILISVLLTLIFYIFAILSRKQ